MANLYINNIKIKNVEMAITSEEQELGLMFIESDPPITVFPYKTASIKKFWMKNVYVPLDIIFCSNGYVIDIKTGQPFDEKTMIGPNENVDVVVEAPYGYCNYKKIKIGSTVNIKYDKINLLKLILS